MSTLHFVFIVNSIILVVLSQEPDCYIIPDDENFPSCMVGSWSETGDTFAGEPIYQQVDTQGQSGNLRLFWDVDKCRIVEVGNENDESLDVAYSKEDFNGRSISNMQYCFNWVGKDGSTWGAHMDKTLCGDNKHDICKAPACLEATDAFPDCVRGRWNYAGLDEAKKAFYTQDDGYLLLYHDGTTWCVHQYPTINNFDCEARCYLAANYQLHPDNVEDCWLWTDKNNNQFRRKLTVDTACTAQTGGCGGPAPTPAPTKAGPNSGCLSAPFFGHEFAKFQGFWTQNDINNKQVFTKTVDGTEYYLWGHAGSCMINPTYDLGIIDASAEAWCHTCFDGQDILSCNKAAGYPSGWTSPWRVKPNWKTLATIPGFEWVSPDKCSENAALNIKEVKEQECGDMEELCVSHSHPEFSQNEEEMKTLTWKFTTTAGNNGEDDDACIWQTESTEGTVYSLWRSENGQWYIGTNGNDYDGARYICEEQHLLDCTGKWKSFPVMIRYPQAYNNDEKSDMELQLSIYVNVQECNNEENSDNSKENVGKMLIIAFIGVVLLVLVIGGVYIFMKKRKANNSVTFDHVDGLEAQEDMEMPVTKTTGEVNETQDVDGVQLLQD